MEIRLYSNIHNRDKFAFYIDMPQTLNSIIPQSQFQQIFYNKYCMVDLNIPCKPVEIGNFSKSEWRPFKATEKVIIDAMNAKNKSIIWLIFLYMISNTDPHSQNITWMMQRLGQARQSPLSLCGGFLGR